MKKSVVIGLVAIVVIGSIVALSQNNSDDTGMNMPASDTSATSNSDSNMSEQMPTEIQSGTVSIDIMDFNFSPETIRVEPGTTVTWTNRDTASHDVHPDQPSDSFARSELLAQGESYSVTFDEVGEYSYFCTPHPYMQATVIVEES
ncbi:hypothetical protein BH23PAT2_BH23PAT2_06280 [soil metagenome]